MYATIEWAVDGHIATIKLNRPEKKNVIGPEMVNELLHALEAATNEPAVRVVVLGANGKVFCGGGDLGQMSGGTSDAPAVPIKGDYSDLLLALLRMTKPVIAKVHGAAMGGGLGLVAASTMSVASSDARLGTPEIDVGLFPMMIMSVLARTMPRRALLEMMLLAKKLPADEALRLGLLNRVVAPERLDAEVAELAGQLAQKSPTAIARGLRAYAKMGEMALAEALPWLRDELYGLLGTEDAREGLMAFMQKRTPTWVGR